MATMRAVQIDQPGGPDNLYVREVPVPELRDREVLLKVYASAINRADTLQREGKYPVPPGASTILGLEAAGTVEKCGPGVTRWKVGDRVTALLTGGGNAEFATVHEDHVIAIPAGMSFIRAAAIPEVWLTAFQILHTVGGFVPGDYVLIHAGGSGVGTSAVQLVKAAGGHAIVTAGTQEKIQKALALGAVAGFNYKEGEFASKVKEVTKGKGVNLILDCVGASYWPQNADAIATDGRWVLYGTLGGTKIEGDLFATILRKRVTLTGSTLRARSVEYKAKLVKDFTAQCLEHFQSGQFETVIDRTFPLDQIAAAHHLMDSNKNIGKIIIEVRKESEHSEL